MTYSLQEISSIVHGELHGPGNATVLHLVTDSRKIVDAETSIFIALTDKRDGHHFIPEVLRAGVRSFLVNRLPEQTGEGSYILVKDTLAALQQLAAHHRQQFNYTVIGLTGSNGKTIVKEWLNHLLQHELRIVRSPKSYNSQIGVPLSLWQMHEQADLAIIEAGISHKGEMEKLARMVRPDIGIFTNIGEAHSEGFSSRRDKIREKLQLFAASRTLIYCADYPDLDEEAQTFSKAHGISLFRWSQTGIDAQMQVLEVLQHDRTTWIRIRYQQQEYSFTIPFTGQAPVENALSCAALLLHMNLASGLGDGMQHLPALSMRLEMRHGINRCVVVNDSYSNDLSSLNQALAFMEQQQQKMPRTVILSDIPESGKDIQQLYTEVASLLKRYGINRLKGIGPQLTEAAPLFRQRGMETDTWMSTEEFLLHFNPMHYREEIILLKGARSFGFEQIGRLLEQKLHQTVLTVNLSAIAENLGLFRSMLRPGTKVMVMVKAFSYGSGSQEIASLLQYHKVDWLAVAYADEGVELRKSGISIPIMVMNPEPSSFALMVDHDLQPEIFSMEILQQFHAFLQQQGITEFPIHVKLDTGMHRLGFGPEEVGALSDELLKKQILRVVTAFTHLVGSEDPAEDAFTLHQAELFSQACALMEQKLGYTFTKHISNTAAITRHPGLQMDMVRLGIGLYGISTSPQSPAGLKEAATLTTTIAQIRKVRAGETVGYNRKGRVDRDSLIATIRIGYADGYPRALGNGAGKVMIRNKLYPVIGSVCMDMTMVDITDGPDIRTDEEVTIFGNGLALNRLSEWAGTIPYDIMTGISQRVKRVYVEH